MLWWRRRRWCRWWGGGGGFGGGGRGGGGGGDGEVFRLSRGGNGGGCMATAVRRSRRSSCYPPHPAAPGKLASIMPLASLAFPMDSKASVQPYLPPWRVPSIVSSRRISFSKRSWKSAWSRQPLPCTNGHQRSVFYEACKQLFRFMQGSKHQSPVFFVLETAKQNVRKHLRTPRRRGPRIWRTSSTK